jgi:hypothetical protein
MVSSESFRPEEKTADDEDEDFVEMSFLQSGRISRGIPWLDFSEKEDQAILKIHFERLGFDVIWRHHDDPANEGGIDLECRSPQRRVLVAIKKRPKKDALAQVVELSNEPADQRVYVYIGGASQSFRDQLANFGDKVEFWDEKVLEDRLNASELTRILKSDNSRAYQAVLRIMQILVKTIGSKPKAGPVPRPTWELMETLWGLKDRAVTLHECASMMQLLFENPKRFGELDYDQIQNLIMWALDSVYSAALLSLRHAFEALTPELKRLIFRVHETTRIRSNWLHLFSYTPGLMPGWVDSALKDYEKARDETKKMALITERRRTNRKVQDNVERSHIDEAVGEFRSLAMWAYSLEATVDDLFERCVRGRMRH